MVVFLEKHFEFTTTLTIDECVTRLKTESKRGTGWLASKRDILVQISDDVNGKKFVLERDVGRGLYAEIQGRIVGNSGNSVQVSGFGRVPLLLFLFNTYFIVAAAFFAYLFRAVLPLSIFLLAFCIIIPISLSTTFKNRDDLIKVVYQALNTTD